MWRRAAGTPARALGLRAALGAALGAALAAAAQDGYAQSRTNHLYFELAPNLPDPEPAPLLDERLLYGSVISTVLLVAAAILFFRYTLGRMRRSRFTQE